MNTFTFTGNVGRDAEQKKTTKTTILNFNVATQTGWGENKSTMWIRCSLFGRRAESKLADMLTKGAKVCVSGTLSQSEYEGKSYLNLNVAEVDVMSNRYPEKAGEVYKTPQEHLTANQDDYGDQIPF